MTMENKTRTKRTKRTPVQKSRKDTATSVTASRSGAPGSRQSKGSAQRSTSASNVPVSRGHASPVHEVLGIPINSETARQAIILSEIIGKPVSKRGRRR